MKVERLNNNQIRFVFMAQDLAERDININDILTRSSNKTQGLFQEITALLNEEYEFSTAGTPLMFEATMSHNTLSVLVTKMATEDGQFHGPGGEITSGFAGMVNDVMTQIAQNANGDAGINMHSIPPPENVGKIPPKQYEAEYLVFTFPNIDALAAACAHIDSTYEGRNHVYKMDGKYHLLLQSIDNDCCSTQKIEQLLHEFGQKQLPSPLAYSIMQERGEVIISEDAVSKLKMYLG